MAEDPGKPILDYEPKRPATRVDRYMALGLAANLVAMLNATMTACMCGYMDWTSLPGNLLAVGLAGFGFVAGKGNALYRLALCLLMIIPGFILVWNAHNILWSGHDPLLR